MEMLHYQSFNTKKDPLLIPDASIMFLHGLGSNGYAMGNFVKALELQTSTYNFRCVLVDAPMRAVSLNQGILQQAWYDIYGLKKDTPEDAEGIGAMAKQLTALIEKEQEQYKKVILMGFSQGGAMSLYCAVRMKVPWTGVIILSGYLPLAFNLQKEVTLESRKTPIVFMHGKSDTIVPITWAKEAKEYLETLGYNTIWKEYPHGHEISFMQLQDIKQTLEHLLS